MRLRGFERTDEPFSIALAAYAALGEKQKVVEMHLFLSRQAWNDAQTPQGYAQAMEAIALIGDADNALRDYALTMAASYAVHLGHPERAEELLACTQPSADLAIAARRFDSQSIAHCRLGNAAEALEMSRLARESNKWQVLVGLEPSATGARRRKSIGTYRTRKASSSFCRDVKITPPIRANLRSRCLTPFLR